MIGAALAHDGVRAAGTTTLWNAWALEPSVLVPLALAVWLYARGVRRTWLRAGVGRGVTRPQAACFAAGVTALFMALVWPLDVLGERLFSAHMAQHLTLMNVAAPLIVLGAPLGPMLRALARGPQRAAGTIARSTAWRTLSNGLGGIWTATVLQLAVLWAWHTPRGIAAALASSSVHIAMHLTLMLSALVFWTAVLKPRGREAWQAIGALVVTLKIGGLVSIVLLLRGEPLFAAYGASANAWGLTAADDEHVGWGLMMLVGSGSYLVAAVALAAQALGRLDQPRGHGAG